MDAELKESLVAQFVGVTGSTSERANFFLECAQWNCELAIENFYDNHQEEVPMVSDEESNFPVDNLQPESVQPAPIAAAPPTGARFPASNPQASNRIATFGNLKRSEPSSDEEEEEEEEQEAFYAGGSERGSGQQVLGPKKVDKFVADIFKNAKAHGGELIDPKPSSDRQRGPARFQGTAYRLGSENDPGATIQDPVRPAAQEVHVVLRLWSNGFTVGDGPLRDFRDQAGREFLDDIKKGKIPKELLAQTRGAPVAIDMEDHCQEEYVKPKPVVQAFSGQGFRLGNPTDGAPAAAAMSSSGSSVDQKPAAVDASYDVEVDALLPVTNLQIRMPDGSRLVTKFNQSHTVADVRQFIIRKRPNYSSSNFILMTTFPNREITDESSTLKAANLINTVLVVRMK